MPNKFSTVLHSSLVLFTMALAGAASASVAEWKSFDQKVSEADAIVRGSLISSESRRDPDGRWIRTWSTFSVSEVLKGGAGTSTVTIVTPGGEVDGIHQESVGAPSFDPGREQVIFLKQSAEGTIPLYLDQGVYDVTRDGQDRLLVHPAASNLILYDDQAGRVIPVEATRTLESFRSEIRASIDRQQREIARASSMEGPEKTDWTDFFTGTTLVLLLLAIGLIIAWITWIRRQ